jgi:hypothetical protein
MREHDNVKTHLEVFQSEQSKALILIRRMYPVELTRKTLRSLALVMSALANVPFRPCLSRSKQLILQWFEMNYEVLEPFFQFIESIE